MTVIARKYNPGFLSDEELVSSFCVRLDTFESMVESLRECTGSANTHQIVIGPRGSGKTSLLLRVAAEIRRNENLSSRFFPIVFAEESYEVSTTGEFWLECVSRLAEQAPLKPNMPDLKRSYEELRHVLDDQILGERCLGTLQDFADRESKRLVLIVENLNMMFGDFTDREAGWRLRQTLQTEPRIILLASATSRFDEINNPDHAFYDLLRELTLRPLEPEACEVLWQTISGRERPPETVRALRILTGGNPRLLTILARFGANLSFHELMDDLLDLVDDHTEYFKSHLDALPAQERRVYLALANLWMPATAREIADWARLDTSKCSAQLARLVDRGVVEVIGGSARRKQYYLTERLYNIYYLMRRSRGTAPLVEALIQFMEAYYSPSELKDFAIRTVRESIELDNETKQVHQIAFDRLLESPFLTEQRKELSILTSWVQWVHPFAQDDADVVKVKFDKAFALADKGHVSVALVLWNDVIQQLKSSNAVEDLEVLAYALVNKGTALRILNRMDESIAAWDEVFRRFGMSETPRLISATAAALTGKAAVFLELGRPKEALAVCEEVLHRLEQGSAAQYPLEIAKVHCLKGLVLFDLGQPEEALPIWDEIVDRLGASDSPTVFPLVARALAYKGAVLVSLNRYEEALNVFDEIIERFESSDSPTVFPMVLRALVHKGSALVSLKRLEEAIEVWEETLKHSTHSNDPITDQLVGIAIAQKSILLDTMGRKEEGLVFRNETIQGLCENEEIRFVLAAVNALALIGEWLVEQNRFQEAVSTWDEIMLHFGFTNSPMLNDAVAAILVKKGKVLAQMNRKEDALAVWEDVVQRFESSNTAITQESVAWSLVHMGKMLADLNRTQDALNSMEKVIERFGSKSIKLPSLQNIVSIAFLVKAMTLTKLNRLKEAVVMYDEVLNRNIADTMLDSMTPIATALLSKGEVLVELNRSDEALTVWNDLIRRFAKSMEPRPQYLANRAQLRIAELHLSMGRGDASIAAVDGLFEPENQNFPGISCGGYLIRARAHLLKDNKTACVLDVEKALAILSVLGDLTNEIVNSLCWLAIELGPAQLRELIVTSQASYLLLPLTTALERELGLETRVAREIEEVAEDIHRDLEMRRKGSFD